MEQKKDPYKILGIPPWATLEEVKEVFRRRIKSCHPDLGAGIASNVEEFQAVKKAYETLLKKLAQQTKPQSGYPANSSAVPPVDGAFLFLEISPQDALKGAVIETKLWDGEEFCFKCQGAGKIQDKGQKICQECHGKGHTSIPWGDEHLSMVCKSCSGSGFVGQPTCPVCKGKGRISRLRKVRVSLPRGIRSGTLLKLPGQGPYRPERQARDPLYVEVRVELPEGWKINGLDVHSPVEIDVWTALKGGQIPVRTLDGCHLCALPPCTEQGRHIRLPGLGWTDELGKRGDHIAEIRISMPSGTPSPLARTLLRLLRRLWPAGHLPPALPKERERNSQYYLEVSGT